MKKFHFASLAFLAATRLAFAVDDPFINVSLEQHNYQTGADTTSVQSGTDGYSAFAAVEGIPATGVTLTIGAGDPMTVPLDGSFYELHSSYSSSGAMTTAYPTGSTYTFAITSSSSPSGTTAIIGPGGTFDANKPITPIFSFGGISGTWSVEGGMGVFTFNPASVTSFTVSMTAYDVLNPLNKGGHYGSFVDVSDVNNSYTEVGEVGEGPTPDATPSTATTLTFTKDLAANGGDLDGSTYGFVSGSRYYIEGGLFNVFNLGGTTLTNPGETQQAFVFGQTTGFILQAIPEPSTAAQLAGGLAVVAACVFRRRRAR